ncbi:MAG: hypothetical protein H8D23_27115 [Candidatus Brocadiales bacterium]|nr:hypothetical protein [Candidatus Brocadiales bacterium]
MNTIKIICLLALVNSLSAQLPIPSWAQWLSDDEKSWQNFTSIAGCEYEELNMSSHYTVKEWIVEHYIKEGWEITEENIEASLEKYWKSKTEEYPLNHIKDGYRMVRIVDAGKVSASISGKVVVWEWYFTVENTSSSKLRVSVEYHLTKENIIFTRATDGMYFYLDSGETGTYSSTDYFPIDDLEEIENRTWTISYDY